MCVCTYMCYYNTYIHMYIVKKKGPSPGDNKNGNFNFYEPSKIADASKYNCR